MENIPLTKRTIHGQKDASLLISHSESQMFPKKEVEEEEGMMPHN